ncbi:hypothetical protein [Candidatus Harpocratesius sp.]
MSNEKLINRREENWKKYEPIISIVGKYSWGFIVLTLIIQTIVVISNFKALNDAKAALDLLSPNVLFYDVFKAEYEHQIAVARFAIIWFFISAVVMAGLILIAILPFAKKCGEKDWHGIKNDVFTVGNYRIPKILAFAVFLEFFTYGYGALIILILVLLIIFMEPEPMQWKT